MPNVAKGAGSGVALRKSGWICASLTAGLGGRETSGIILGGGVRSSISSPEDSEIKGPFRARAGELDRLPGIGSNVVPLEGTVSVTASRAGRLTLLVSQLSKGSACDVLSTECRFEKTLRASGLAEHRLISVERDVTGRTCRSDSRNDLSDCEERAENVGDGSVPMVMAGGGCSGR